jgi:pimeloyl-ACP methyl ester carboxylesterase
MAARIRRVSELGVQSARIAFESSGAGEPVLLIQGVGAVGHAWEPQVLELEAHFRLVSFDHRGIGASSAGDEPLSIELMAQDALALCDHLGFDRFHVVGHSMGGLIAQALALAVPERVRSLALLCTFPDGPDGARLKPGMLGPVLRSRIGTRRLRRQAFLELVYPKQFLESLDREAFAEAQAELFGRDLADQPPVINRQLSVMSRFDARSRLGALGSIPTLILAGQYDLIAPPASARALGAALPSARLVELAGAGHALPIQFAAIVNDLLGQHFRQAGTRSA